MSVETHGSAARPPRPLVAGLLSVVVVDTLARLRGEDAYRSDGRNSETIVSDGPARVIVTVVDGGRDVGGETSDGHVSLFLLEGEGTIVRGDAQAALRAGTFVVLGPGSAWSLRAESPCGFVASFWQPA